VFASLNAHIRNLVRQGRVSPARVTGATASRKRAALMEEFDDVILGAGLGGLSAAACLARQGRRVVVLEQHDVAGGCGHTFDYGKYSFCADVHYISQCGPGQTLTVFLDYIGKEVPFNSLDADCIDRVVTPDVDFRIPLGWENLRSRLHLSR
jgi:all-trans-retinol 13,14-reductase